MKRRLLINTLLSGGHTFIAGVIGLFLLPFTLHHLGLLEVGLLGIVNIFAMSGYIGLFELGLQSSIAKYSSEYATKGSFDKVAVLVNSAATVFLTIGAVLALLGVVFAGLITRYALKIPTEYEASFTIAVSAMFASYVFVFPGIAIQGLLEGLQRFAALKGIQVSVVIANAIGTVILLLLGYRYTALVALLVVLQIAQCVAMYTYALSTVPRLRLDLRLFSTASLREVRGMTGMLFAGRISSHIFNNTDRLLVGAILGGLAMGAYDIVIRFPRLLKLVLGFINTAVMPAVSQLNAEGRQDVVRRLLLFGTNVHMIASYPLVTGLMYYAAPLLRAWVGQDYVYLAPALRWALGYNLLVAVIGIGGSVVVGSNKALRTFTAVGMTSTVLNVAFTLTFIRVFGLEGVFMATVLAVALTLPLYVWTILRVAPVTQWSFWAQIVRVLASGFVPLTAAMLLGRWFKTDTIPELMAAGAVWVILYWASLYVIASGRQERDALRTIAALVLRPGRP